MRYKFDADMFSSYMINFIICLGLFMVVFLSAGIIDIVFNGLGIPYDQFFGYLFLISFIAVITRLPYTIIQLLWFAPERISEYLRYKRESKAQDIDDRNRFIKNCRGMNETY